MLVEPRILQVDAQQAAVIGIVVPRAGIHKVMAPGVAELMTAIAAQGIAPAGPIFSHHRTMDPNFFNFEIGVPVQTPVAPVGRVQMGQLPAATIARTIYRGGYEGLGPAWAEFEVWIKAAGRFPAASLWECYVSGPESGPDPSQWQTELNRPLYDLASAP